MTDRLAYRPNEAAELLGVSRDVIFKLLAKGELKGFKVGNVRLISSDELKAYVERRSTDDTPPPAPKGYFYLGSVPVPSEVNRAGKIALYTREGDVPTEEALEWQKEHLIDTLAKVAQEIARRPKGKP